MADPVPPVRRWLVVAAVLWALLLLLLGYLSVGREEPTVREQRSIAQAAPVVDRAAGELVAAAGADVVAELSPPEVHPGCRLTPFLDGATLERSVTLRTTPGAEAAVLDRIASGLPQDYRTRVRHTDGEHRIRADAGEFVAIRGGMRGPGVIGLTLDTGCRPRSPDFDPAAGLLPASRGDLVLAHVGSALAVTGSQPASRVSAPCPGGGVVTTVWTTGSTTRDNLPAAVRKLAGPGLLTVGDPPSYAYRSGSAGVVVEPDGSTVRLAVTTGCDRQ